MRLRKRQAEPRWEHCWHGPRAFSTVKDTINRCCYCGVTRAMYLERVPYPGHGPYAPETLVEERVRQDPGPCAVRERR